VRTLYAAAVAPELPAGRLSRSVTDAVRRRVCSDSPSCPRQPPPQRRLTVADRSGQQCCRRVRTTTTAAATAAAAAAHRRAQGPSYTNARRRVARPWDAASTVVRTCCGTIMNDNIARGRRRRRRHRHTAEHRHRVTTFPSTRPLYSKGKYVARTRFPVIT